MKDVLHRNNVHVKRGGESTMLFAHGFGCDHTVWKDIFPAFAQDHKIVLFDFVGAGKSDVSQYERFRYSNLKDTPGMRWKYVMRYNFRVSFLSGIQ